MSSFIDTNGNAWISGYHSYELVNSKIVQKLDGKTFRMLSGFDHVTILKENNLGTYFMNNDEKLFILWENVILDMSHVGEIRDLIMLDDLIYCLMTNQDLLIYRLKDKLILVKSYYIPKASINCIFLNYIRNKRDDSVTESTPTNVKFITTYGALYTIKVKRNGRGKPWCIGYVVYFDHERKVVSFLQDRLNHLVLLDDGTVMTQSLAGKNDILDHRSKKKHNTNRYVKIEGLNNIKAVVLYNSFILSLDHNGNVFITGYCKYHTVLFGQESSYKGENRYQVDIYVFDNVEIKNIPPIIDIQRHSLNLVDYQGYVWTHILHNLYNYEKAFINTWNEQPVHSINNSISTEKICLNLTKSARKI